MTDLRSLALKFEAQSVALKKQNAGNVLTLRIHPSEMPKELWEHPLGSRYMVALVLLADDDTPAEGVAAVVPQSGHEVAQKNSDKPKREWKQMRLTERAGIICGEPEFWEWCAEMTPLYGVKIEKPEQAADWLRWKTAVGSRKEYETDPRAANRYLDIEKAYHAHKMDKERYGDV